MKKPSIRHKNQCDVFRKHGGILRSSQAIDLGIHPRDLHAMKSAGLIETISRGLYRLSDMPPLSRPDLATVALRVPHGVICLISALAFHNITTQIPHEVDVALERGARKPRLGYPPTEFVWLSRAAFEAGMETHRLDGVVVRIYSPEKTVADCFKFRTTVGLDVAIEALKFCRSRKRSTVDALMHYAEVDRVEKIMKPYMEAIL